MAPEYVMHGNLSIKADVYSFGVVVLELVSGQKNFTFDLDPECVNLLDWAYKMYKKGKGLEILEPILASNAVPDQVATCIKNRIAMHPIRSHCPAHDEPSGADAIQEARHARRTNTTRISGSRPRRSRASATSSSSDGMSRGTNSQSRSTTTSRNPTASTTAPRTPRRHASSTSDPHRRHRGSTSAGPVSDPYGKRPMRE